MGYLYRGCNHEHLYIYIIMIIVITNKLRIIQHTVNYLIKDLLHQNFIVGSWGLL